MSDGIGLNTGPDGSRPLPARPNLEFEKKRAKKLVRARGGEIALAEAQLMIAREYGFASWRKLLAYYSVWERHQNAEYQGWRPGRGFDHSVSAILKEFADRRALTEQPPDVYMTAAAAAKYIPRFFGLSNAEIFAAELTEAEARLIVARRWRIASWDALAERQKADDLAAAAAPSEAEFRERERTRAPGPIRLDDLADGANDAERVTSMFAKRPELRSAPGPHAPYDDYAWKLALRAQMGTDASAMSVREVITRSGIDLQPHLNHALLGRPGWGERTEYVRGLLELGADATWMPPNGFSVLEHAIALYRNGEAVDLLRARVSLRRSFWSAAGVGDVRATRSFLGRSGVLHEAARRHRLDMTALGSRAFETGRPDAPDVEIAWEAFLIAGLNSRLDTMKLLLDFGFPVDYTPHSYNMLHVAVTEANLPVVEFLLDHGANPDFRVIPSVSSPLDYAAVNYDPANDDTARIVTRARIRDLLRGRSTSGAP